MPFVLNLKPQIVRCVCSQSSINRRVPGRGSLAWAAKKTDADVTTTEVPKKKPGRKRKETIQLEEVILHGELYSKYSTNDTPCSLILKTYDTFH